MRIPSASAAIANRILAFAVALFEALSSDEVDAIIMNDTISSDDAMAMFSVGESNYYLTTRNPAPT